MCTCGPWKNSLWIEMSFLQTISDVGSDDFTIKVYHGGKILMDKKGEKQYVGGKVDFYDGCNVDKFSFCVLDWLAKLLGYKGATSY